MSSQFKPDQLVTAIVTKLATRLAGVAQAKQLASDDFNEQGELIPLPPMVLVLWARSTPTVNRDNVRTSYQDEHLVELWSGDRNLRSLVEEGRNTLALVARVRDEVAGARWSLADGTLTQPTILGETELLEAGREGTWYTTRIRVPHSAQFTGPNIGG